MSLSVIVPTLNCAQEVSTHIKSMEPWLDLADEIIAVDSDSEDGTPEIVRETIHHPGLRQINHPRGLYQSWNHAISQSTGKWIYISTIGDTITREQLEHLLEAGEALGADVVVSPPEFVFESHVTIDHSVWPVHRILEFHDIRKPSVIDPLAAFVHAVKSNPDAILGSSASNIYRGDHLRARPFPTVFRMAGDTGWAIRHALETRFCYTPKVGSIFRFHSDTYTCPDHEANERLVASLHEEGMKAARENQTTAHRELLDILEESLNIKRSYQLARREWGLSKRESRVPWYLRPSAIQMRQRRKILRQKSLQYMDRLNDAIKELPLQTAS